MFLRPRNKAFQKWSVHGHRNASVHIKLYRPPVTLALAQLDFVFEVLNEALGSVISLHATDKKCSEHNVCPFFRTTRALIAMKIKEHLAISETISKHEKKLGTLKQTKYEKGRGWEPRFAHLCPSGPYLFKAKQIHLPYCDVIASIPALNPPVSSQIITSNSYEI